MVLVTTCVPFLGGVFEASESLECWHGRKVLTPVLRVAGDLKGCIQDYCKCPTPVACADGSFVEQCPGSCPARYLHSQGWSDHSPLLGESECVGNATEFLQDELALL